MAHLQVAMKQSPLFPYWKWEARLPELIEQYRQNRPGPHVHLTEFLDPEVALDSAESFPNPQAEGWVHYKHHNENKLGMNQRDFFPGALGEVTDELNSPEFLSWLSKLTGISNLVSDPTLEGGGLHQSSRGGFLNVHTDFTMHHYHKNWRRRVNLVLYLNPNWRSEWGGAIEFWDNQMKSCVARYTPLFNHAIIFSTDDLSLHGFPDPLRCPENETRRSLALYYYTVESESAGRVVSRSTDYRARPSDGVGNAALIWLDKQAVNLYSKAKVRFGFSDNLASRILSFISRKK